MEIDKKNQLFVSQEKWFSLHYPRMWEMEVIENIPFFFDSIKGQGALQVFSVKLGSINKITKEIEEFPFLKGKSLAHKMQLFLRQQNIRFEKNNLNIYKNKDTFLMPYEYYLDQRFYMVCMLQKKHTFLLTLYNCADQPTEEEASVVGKIVHSIQIH